MTRAIAVLRPEPGNARTVAVVTSLGLRAIPLPLFAITPLAWQATAADYDVLLATSANAFRHGGEGLSALRGLPVVAVGGATAAAARGAGFTVEAIGDGDAAALVPFVTGRRLLHLAGREHRALPGADVIAVYAADPVAVPPAAIQALAGHVALLHSPRAARRFSALVPAAIRPTIRLATLSPAIAVAAGKGWAEIAVAPALRDETLVAVAAELARRGAIDRAALRGNNRSR